MYDFHYNYIKKKYGQCAKLFTDTDSLCYNISTENIYEDMMRDIHLFNTSEYDPEHPLYSTENKKVLGENEGRNTWHRNTRIRGSQIEDVFHDL
jgi:hypothetical protein